MSVLESRRSFLKTSTMVIGGATLLGGAGLLTGCAAKEPELEIPSFPYKYAELDAGKAEASAYDGYYEGGCCYGVAKSMLEQLRENFPVPYDFIPVDLYRTGKEGYGMGTICGALAGAVNVISMCCTTEDAKGIISELFAWYCSTSLPMYRPDGLSSVQTVAGSINCDVSVSGFKKTADVEQDDPIRRERCGGVSGDVARKAVELLNIHYGFAKAPASTPEPTMAPLADNEYIGEAEGFGGPIKVRVTMDGDTISKIDILEHAETAGISTPGFDNIPAAIIEAQSTSVDVASGATLTSKGIMAAVEDALSKVK